IQKFNVNGQFVDLWASGGVYPYGIAIDGSGYVYVADTYNHRIQVFNANGQFVAQWGSWGSGAGQFVYPHGIAAPHISIPPPGPDIGTIQGIVYSDMSYALITAATVQAGLGSAIVQNGVFTMKVNAGMWDLQVSSGDYGNKTLPEVIVVAGEVTDVSILMSSSIAGDINGDGNINIADTILALQVISGVYLSPAVIIYKEAHLNGDGKIGMEEVIYILQKVAGMR
ncbi:MAG: 6-bladed beta-propeller, partial [Deltaproteobacteria bacterium]|nr:6-bladed beta-propeller [Deltaproteobacteria bacterium]